ncbi:hypothetical protein SAMN04489729_0856 [Amycolatopsis lurida]|uniref:Uncharacterized protein n=1 Tax=Amycolatopsis lurida NRRL 2430 TaxID=1460371 RepID=A0A2P2FM03_AMYLU|nr:hypothetical protein [Amycolatopsis lurida]KFU77755.1 hypothetical protein BB31_29240 [Amycolatopsis lurida NRRL 2430]SEB39372.1 hypothetical protein SAMN04489729_0856 [Amycolatopsis lurida]
MPDTRSGTAITDPASVLTPAVLQAARNAAATAPPFTTAQRDRLSCIFGPTVRRVHLNKAVG